jgi:hypothetical protein
MIMMALALAGLEAPISRPTVIQTALYDLISAIGESVEPHEEALTAAITMQVLATHRVIPIGHTGQVRPRGD